jgi:hypothetical protein
MTNTQTVTAKIAGRPVRFAYAPIFAGNLPFVAAFDIMAAARVGIVDRVSRMRHLERKCDASLLLRVNIDGSEEIVIATAVAGWLVASQISRGRIAPAALDEFFAHVNAIMSARDKFLLAAAPAAGNA